MAEPNRVARRKACPFCKEEAVYVDYKDPAALRKFVTERGKIKPRRVTAACVRHQRAIAHAVKNAREMALMPYVVVPVSGRSERRGR